MRRSKLNERKIELKIEKQLLKRNGKKMYADEDTNV